MKTAQVKPPLTAIKEKKKRWINPVVKPHDSGLVICSYVASMSPTEVMFCLSLP